MGPGDLNKFRQSFVGICRRGSATQHHIVSFLDVLVFRLDLDQQVRNGGSCKAQTHASINLHLHLHLSWRWSGDWVYLVPQRFPLGCSRCRRICIGPRTCKFQPCCRWVWPTSRCRWWLTSPGSISVSRPDRSEWRVSRLDYPVKEVGAGSIRLEMNDWIVSEMDHRRWDRMRDSMGGSFVSQETQSWWRSNEQLPCGCYEGIRSWRPSWGCCCWVYSGGWRFRVPGSGKAAAAPRCRSTEPEALKAHQKPVQLTRAFHGITISIRHWNLVDLKWNAIPIKHPTVILISNFDIGGNWSGHKEPRGNS